MAERVDDATEAPAVLVGCRVHDNCPRYPSSLDRRVRVVDDEEQTDAAAPERLRAEVPVRGRLVRDPERRVADGQLGDDVGLIVRAADPVELDRAECLLVEHHRLASPPDRELRDDSRLDRPVRICHRVASHRPRSRVRMRLRVGARDVLRHDRRPRVGDELADLVLVECCEAGMHPVEA